MLSDISLKDKLLCALAAALAALFCWSGIEPFDRSVWYVEVTWPLAAYLALLFTFKKFRFSIISYLIVSIWIALHIIGAKYSFERVPFEYVTNAFGFARNHYDRLAHFAIGLNAFGVAEFILRKNYVKGATVAAFFGIIFIMAMANAWELVEWAYAEIDGGETGAAFLGSQGDFWDAQKDMLTDTLGAIFSALFFPLYANKFIKEN